MAEDGIVFVFVDVVDADMSVRGELMSDSRGCGRYKPLEIIWTWVFVLLIRAEGADVTGGIMD